jgi:hypothetical protein
MEYFRDPKNQIYADLAYRLGRIVVQYEQLQTKEEKFEASLYLAILQNLMTNCNEYVRQMTRSSRRNSIFKKELADSDWGVNKSCWLKNTFNENPTLENFIARIRNSVSHPTNTDIESNYPSTGFSTIKDNGSRIIQKYRFINSPDVRDNRLKEYTYEQIINILERYKSEFPTDVIYESMPGQPEKYRFTYRGDVFMRISIIDLSVKQLGSFVKKLANYLAQPIEKDWDGETIKDMLAA